MSIELESEIVFSLRDVRNRRSCFFLGRDNTILYLRSSDLLLQLCFVSCSSSWIDHYYRKLSDCVFFRASLILELLEIINGKIPIAETKAQKGRPTILVIARIIGRLVCSSQNTAMNPRPFQYVWVFQRK